MGDSSTRTRPTVILMCTTRIPQSTHTHTHTHTPIPIQIPVPNTILSLSLALGLSTHFHFTAATTCTAEPVPLGSTRTTPLNVKREDGSDGKSGVAIYSGELWCVSVWGLRKWMDG
ncbi:uncharacterized protein EKO05_0001532 [Ascochyta rabiei]|uniref:uncharacterized protein n=1 Tax=Didymella rabiei TaxID=5454 RepID=UPI0022051BAA|nr:uncharacterized protein EKO05_0001532 [Ascochyta rabiei]UPX10897.1 hypothetical protein EKO05_0001532 [Ascochyta rabiei]